MPWRQLASLLGPPLQNFLPIKAEQLAALLDALQEAKKEELRLAVALVGLFGLRPAELGVLRVEEGRLYVGNVKRNARTLKVANAPAPGWDAWQWCRAAPVPCSILIQVTGSGESGAAEGVAAHPFDAQNS